jgi:hypothetical protein
LFAVGPEFLVFRHDIPHDIKGHDDDFTIGDDVVLRDHTAFGKKNWIDRFMATCGTAQKMGQIIKLTQYNVTILSILITLWYELRSLLPCHYELQSLHYQHAIVYE